MRAEPRGGGGWHRVHGNQGQEGLVAGQAARRRWRYPAPNGTFLGEQDIVLLNKACSIHRKAILQDLV